MAKQRTPTLATPIAPIDLQELGKEGSRKATTPSQPSNPDRIHAGVVAFRPVVRPPAASVIVVDDGGQTGELVRLCRDKTTIGRENTDVQIPHDNQISRSHAEILRIRGEGKFRWFLKDCNSSNGTFVRVLRTRVRPDQELLLGGKRYCLREAQSSPSADSSSNDKAKNSTSAWQVVDADTLEQNSARLVEKLPDGSDGMVITLTSAETVLGCSAELPHPIQDRCLNPKHATLKRSDAGEWVIEDLGSLNGIWIRINRLELNDTCEIQIGEQRMLYNPPK